MSNRYGLAGELPSHAAVIANRLRCNGFARPMNPAWVRLLRDQCQAAGVAFFFKQWGAWRPASVINRPDRRCAYTANPAPMVRVGKTAAGRELDGRTWTEFPEVTP